MVETAENKKILISNVFKIVNIIQIKTALRLFDTKRWICEDNIHNIAHAHFQTRVVYYIDWNGVDVFTPPQEYDLDMI